MAHDAFYCNKEAAQKIVYEFRMLEFCRGEIAARCETIDRLHVGKNNVVGTSHQTGDQMRVSAFLESMLIHTRVLMDFFYKPRDPKFKLDDSIVASDFIPNWPDIRPAKGTYLESRKEHLNKAMAHLGRKRIDYEEHDEKGWDLTKVSTEINHVIRLFNENLPESMKNWFVPSFDLTEW